MNFFEIPLESEAKRFSFGADLDGREFVITLDWSSRDEDWFMSLANAAGEMLMAGQRP